MAKVKKEENALALTNMDKVEALDKVATEYGSALVDPKKKFHRAFITAMAIQKLEEMIDDEVVEDCIMPLANNKLGFLTDKDPNRKKWNPKSKKMEAAKPYEAAVIKRCMIEATLMGVQMVGNQVNVIAGNSYVTKEGFTALLKGLNGENGKPRLTNLKIMPSVPHVKGDSAIVSFKATWMVDGNPDSLDGDIPLKVNERMGIDAINGKADRKIKARIYNQITQSDLTDGDVSEGAIDVTAEVKPMPKKPTVKKAEETPEVVEPEPAPEDEGGFESDTDGASDELVQEIEWLQKQVNDAQFVDLRGRSKIDEAEALEMVDEKRLKIYRQLLRATIA